jgi:pyridoxine 5-phosphate synthase
MIRLGVNIDHIATVRQARRGSMPDPVQAALRCQQAGAHSIVCHLREDRRHIQDEDVRRLRQALRIPLNLEMSIAPSVVNTALAVRPFQVTLVPERRQELTTEGGLDVAGLQQRLTPLIRRFQARGITVSLFIDPAARQVRASQAVGATIVELHTGAFANAARPAQAKQLLALRQGGMLARQLGLAVAAGHGLDYGNIGPVARLSAIEEVNIGFAIISRALDVGLSAAVREMKRLLR